jgi:hypothetical protein
MKKNKYQNQFLDELKKVPIVQVACEKTGLSRNSVYRWRKEDKDFAKIMDDALAEGVALVNDMSESQLFTLIKEKNYSAISFWLRHRNVNYKDKLEITNREESEELTESQAQIVKEALALANITKAESINNINTTEIYEQNDPGNPDR